MSGGFQTSVNTQPAPGVAGDFASANPRFSFDAGPGGLTAGPSGLTVGLFAWVTAAPVDADGTGSQANNSGSGSVAGFVHREQQALITTYLADAGLVIPAGFQCALMTGGDFWVKNDSATVIAVPGMKAYAANATGKVRFGASGSATAGATSTTSTISAETASVTGSINGNLLTVTAVGSGTLVDGGVIAGSAGSAGGDAVASGTKIVKQLSGTIGGVGTYLVSIPEQNVTSTTITETYGLLTVSGTLTGTFAVNDKLTGTGVVAGSTITGLGTGTGGAGTYYTQTQAASATAIGAESDVETKWYAMSSGRPGELVKISDHALG